MSYGAIERFAGNKTPYPTLARCPVGVNSTYRGMSAGSLLTVEELP
jgi:hypothetical protein